MKRIALKIEEFNKFRLEPKLFKWYARRALLPLMRGLYYSFFHLMDWKFLMLGRSTRIMYWKHLKLGKWVYVGDYSQINALTRQGIHIGRRTTIREFGLIQGSSNPLTLGEGLILKDNVYIGPRSNIGIGGLIVIGRGTQIGASFTCVAENHLKIDGKISKREVRRSGISIGDDCWIGHNVTILDGVKIGNDVTIGAGSIVTKSFDDGVTIVGNPARILEA